MSSNVSNDQAARLVVTLLYQITCCVPNQGLWHKTITKLLRKADEQMYAFIFYSIKALTHVKEAVGDYVFTKLMYNMLTFVLS